MCGIFGLIPKKQTSFDIHKIISCVQKEMNHRGPDNFGVSVTSRDSISSSINTAKNLVPELLLCHSRLSIIDLSNNSNQPFISRDKKYQIIFNGEIYNYKLLRKYLQKNGIIFYTQSDTEVLLYGLIFEGKKFILKIQGMFSFAFHNIKENILLIARDHFGIKPLFFYNSYSFFGFCSEIPVLIKGLNIPATLNNSQLFDYLHYFGTSDHNHETFFKNIIQLLPAHYLEYNINNHNFNIEKYWSNDQINKIEISKHDASNEIKRLFISSVKKHLESDVDIAVAVSGGIDSSALASIIRNVNPAQNINTFSYISDLKEQSEQFYIDIINNKIDATRHHVHISSDEFISDLPNFIYHQAQPFRSSSMYSQYKVFQSIHANGYKVVIDGQGADEILGGYTYFIGDRATTLLRQGKIGQLIKLIKYAHKDKKALQTIFKIISNLAPNFLYPIMTAIYGNPLHPVWLNKQWYKEQTLTINTKFKTNNNYYLKGSISNALQRNGIRKLLRYQDHSSMAFSVESRVPFLDVPLVEFILSLPESHIINNHATTKAAFRNAMHDIVPQEILNRRDKLGFNTPELNWLMAKNDFVYDILKDAKDIPVFNSEILISDWNNVINGNKKFHSKIWLWINTILWIKQFNISFN